MTARERSLLEVPIHFAPGAHAMKILLWIVGIIFLIGLLVVIGTGKLIF